MSSNIDITKPTSGTATTASVRANFTAAKSEIEALQAADTALSGRVTTAEGDISSLDGRVSTVEGDVGSLDTRVTALEQGGGGGETLSEATAGTLTDNQTINVTHPAVPLSGSGSGRIRFSALAEVAGAVHDLTTHDGWVTEDLNTTEATWTIDQQQPGGYYYDLGHFSGPLGADVLVGTKAYNSGGQGTFGVIGADPTVPSSVQIDGYTRPSAGAISVAALTGNSGTLSVSNSGTVPNIGRFIYATSGTLLTQAGITEDLGIIRMRGYVTNGSNPRVAVSLDGGTTWKAYNGTIWDTITLNNLPTAGMRLATGSTAPWLDSAGAAVSPEAWAAFTTLVSEAGSGLDLKWAGGFLCDGTSGEMTLQVRWEEPGTIQPMMCPASSGYQAEGFGVKRLSTTQAQFTWNEPFGLVASNFRVQVWS